MQLRTPLKRRPFVRIVACRLDLEANAVDRLAGWLGNEERRRAGRFRLARDRRRYVVAHARLRQLLAARLGTHPRAIELSYGMYGKPFLAARTAAGDWRFNASHSGELALFAFCRGHEVGIDVEALEPLPDTDALARQFFSRAELQAYASLAPPDRKLGFFTCWTRKEARLKARGASLQVSLDNVAAAPAHEAGVSAWRLHSFSPLPGYAAAVAVERSGNGER
ncbi:MAG: 4'-phosphopantetheinyl transferase superfamily protein [Burkholderiales bacterium]